MPNIALKKAITFNTINLFEWLNVKSYFQILFFCLLLVSCGKDKDVVIKEVEKPILLLSTKSLSLKGTENSTATFDLASNIDWTVTSNQAWLTANAESGSNSATLTVTATVNNTTAARSAIITISAKNATSSNAITPQTIDVIQAGNELLTDAKPNWTPVNTGIYQYSITFVANVTNATVVQQLTDGDELAAFVGSECRGAAYIVTNNSVKMFYLMVKGTPGVDKVSFKYYQSSKSRIYNLSQKIDFDANQTYGSPDVPYVFSVNN